MAIPGFWVHGVNTIVEFPDRAKIIRHAGWGTLIEQDADPPDQKNNWFHLPFPSPCLFTDEGSQALLRGIRLRAEVNENARIAEVHYRDDEKLIWSTNLGWVNRKIDEFFKEIGVVDFDIKGALTLCIRVEFLSGTPRGQVIFRSAGATLRMD